MHEMHDCLPEQAHSDG